MKSYQDKFSFISAGFTHSVCITCKGDAYSWGDSTFYQLGHGNNKNISKFTYVERLRGKLVEKIFAGGHHTWFVLDYDEPLDS